MTYETSEDTLLLADCVRQYSGGYALEIGVGAGLVLDELGRQFSEVAGSDVAFDALRRCKGKAGLVCCDAASAFSCREHFDLVVSNPPYLPDEAKDDKTKTYDRTVHGGPAGIETAVHFIRSALPVLKPSGRILVVVSSLADFKALDNFIAEMNVRKKVIREKRLFYETLYVIELSR